MSTPWTHVALSLASSGSPVADKVAVGAQIVYTVKIDAHEAYGAEVDLKFDNTRLTVVGISDGTTFTEHPDKCRLSTVVEANTDGKVAFCGKRPRHQRHGADRDAGDIPGQGGGGRAAEPGRDHRSFRDGPRPPPAPTFTPVR